ncbi:MAG: hypothetical protein ABL959_06060 [Pyrinomonadaceae bacterium]
MKARLIIAVLVTVLASQVAVPRSLLDTVFDDYATFIPWQEEKIRLLNFAVSLEKDPETVGYIAYYVEEGESFQKSRSRILKARNYMRDVGKIPLKRMVMVCAGSGSVSRTILQPWIKEKEFFLKPGKCTR